MGHSRGSDRFHFPQSISGIFSDHWVIPVESFDQWRNHFDAQPSQRQASSEANGSGNAYVFAERLRGVVEAYGQQSLARFPDNPPTISIGVSWALPEKDTPESAIARADRAMYASKRTGRNKVCLEPADQES